LSPHLESTGKRCGNKKLSEVTDPILTVVATERLVATGNTRGNKKLSEVTDPILTFYPHLDAARNTRGNMKLSEVTDPLLTWSPLRVSWPRETHAATRNLLGNGTNFELFATFQSNRKHAATKSRRR
jgi:hypothetical protein